MSRAEPWQVVGAWALLGLAGGALGTMVSLSGGGSLVPMATAGGAGVGAVLTRLGAPERELAVAAAAGLGVVVTGGMAAVALLAEAGTGATLGYTALSVTLLVVARQQSAHGLLARAVEQVLTGQEEVGRAGLRRLHSLRALAPPGVRQQAAYQLGAIALSRGELVEAARWFATVSGGRVGAYAAVARALIAAVLGEPDQAYELLAVVHRRRTEPGVASQADAVRAYLIWRQRGDAEGLELAERLLTATSPVLLRGLTAALRHRGGDPEGARALLDERTRAALVAQRWHLHVPEIGELLAASWE